MRDVRVKMSGTRKVFDFEHIFYVKEEKEAETK